MLKVSTYPTSFRIDCVDQLIQRVDRLGYSDSALSAEKVVTATDVVLGT